MMSRSDHDANAEIERKPGGFGAASAVPGGLRAFLVYPFFKGVWISLHDWNLLAVAFNPGAKSFIGVENYVRVMGAEHRMGAFASPVCNRRCPGIGLALLLRRQGG
jgi:hypothetical protein